jgi:hypothetical protein
VESGPQVIPSTERHGIGSCKYFNAMAIAVPSSTLISPLYVRLRQRHAGSATARARLNFRRETFQSDNENSVFLKSGAIAIQTKDNHRNTATAKRTSIGEQVEIKTSVKLAAQSRIVKRQSNAQTVISGSFQNALTT